MNKNFDFDNQIGEKEIHLQRDKETEQKMKHMMEENREKRGKENV